MRKALLPVAVLVFGASVGIGSRAEAQAKPEAPATSPASRPSSNAPVVKPAPPALTADAWQEDLDALARDLPQKHLDAFFQTPEPEFRKAAADLRARIPSLDTPAIVLGFARLAAMLRDGHTSVDISPYSSHFHRFPVMVLVLKDGAVVVATGPEQEYLRGKRLEAINGVPLKAAIDRVAAYYSWENEATKMYRIRDMLPLAEVLRVAEVTTNSDHATYTFADSKGGELQQVELTAVPASAWEWSSIRLTPEGAARFSFQRKPQALWWVAVPETKALYVRYDRCKDDPDKTIKQYCAELDDRVGQGGIERVIIDLRQNGGGSSSLLDPFIARLGRRKEFKAEGSIITLIGRATFSSAQMNAVRLRTAAHSVLIGGPTGQKPNAHGEIKHFELPNSHLKVWYSTKMFFTEHGDSPSTMPDVLVEPSVRDYLAGRDLVLEAALAYQPVTPAKAKKK